ncbi:MAG TPA: ribonuclease E/G [Methylocella sp.]|nr:ribonuclease E/G [Methylocella sp.]
MSNKMLIDASHPEETRVVVLRGNRVEEFDFESASKKQLRGNIYLAKVMRVEPSLQAAFVDYGGNRHGFLAFSEIHPDYYQIPVADRQALLEEEARAQRDEEEDVSRPPRRSRRFRRGERAGQRAEKRHEADQVLSEPYAGEAGAGEEAAGPFPEIQSGGPEDPGPDRFTGISLPEDEERDFGGDAAASAPGEATEFENPQIVAAEGEAGEGAEASHPPARAPAEEFDKEEAPGAAQPEAVPENREEAFRPAPAEADEGASGPGEDESAEIEQLGGNGMEEVPFRPHRVRRQYKIQEVIKRRQVLLVQVAKEERGNKGAALTTYLSLAGRYSVLMPNTARGGGISRKITDPADRQRLKAIAQELEVPEGMGVIVRTAGASRTKAEIKRDFEYLMRMWETVRETTLKSTAPTLVYEEGSLIKRSIRDLYNKEIDEIIVAGEEGYREAKEFMRLLMPSHAKLVQPYRDPQPLFAKAGVEAQLDAMFSNQVTLKSGGYIVINQTEALVAIDVNSGRATREHNIEDTALRTNLEAADEISRQLRLRDLAGLIVIDFIDMEESRNNRTVERRLKEALKNDRARIQIGRMSHFGLLEMSRQRMRTGVLEGSTVPCPHCGGAGMVRATSSIALHVLRGLEDALIKSADYDIIVKTRTAVALYILNQKRSHLRDLESRFGVSVTVAADESLPSTSYFTLQRGDAAAGPKEAALPGDGAPPIAPRAGDLSQAPESSAGFDGEAVEGRAAAEGQIEDSEGREAEGDAHAKQRRRRRRRRGRGSEREISGIAPNAPQPPDDGLEAMAKLEELRPAPHADNLEGGQQDDGETGAGSRERHERARPASRNAEGHAAAGEAPAAGEPLALSAAPEGFAESMEHNELAGNEPEEAEPAGADTAHPARPLRGRRAPRAPRARGARKAHAAAGTIPLGATADEAVEKPGAALLAAAPAEASSVSGDRAAREPPLPEQAVAETAGEAQESSPSAERASAAMTAGEPERPKRSGWWQRARAGWRS